MKKDIFDAYADAIAEKFHLTLGEMFSKTRKREIVEARQMLYFLARERPIRLSYIKRFMEENGLPVDHSTIMHGYKKAKNYVDSDPDYKYVVDTISSKLRLQN
mgnify:FL=1|jgi:chromosomal replication initiator protein|tara:strand:+ start:663 stop:971 length:309 start_codon:yes stop_codon:yes gene_type:complete